MSDSISTLDDNYIRLGRAAVLVAHEQPQRSSDDVMDHFKRGLFAGEFDAPPYGFGERRNDPSYWLHMEIEAPRCTLPPSQAALKVRPKQLYGVNRETVASVPLMTDALPGARADWEPLFDFGAPDYTAEGVYSALVAIPFRNFSKRGRQELEAIIAPKAKLALWFERRGWPRPRFLTKVVEKQRDAVEATSSETAAPDERPSGRPQKPAWPRIGELVRKLAGEHPDWQKKRLAFEAWRRAREEFSESELPSVATIQRSMVEILDGGSG